MKELLYLKDDQLKEFIEKISVSYKKTFSDAKKILDKHSIGIAHHKVILLLATHKGITISELLKKLRVTKQSLNRVLKDLIKLEIIVFKKDEQDKYDNAPWDEKRRREYPSTHELVVALYDTDDKAAIEKRRADVKAKYPKP